MVPAFTAGLVAISGSLAASTVAKVTVITAVALLAAWLARGSRAAVRHALLAAMFGVILLLPIASVVVPPIQLGVPVTVENPASGLLPVVTGVEPIPPVLMTDGAEGHVLPQSSRISLSSLLLAAWIAGGAMFLLPVVTGLWQIHLLRRWGLPWRRGQSLAETIARGAGVHRRVQVVLHEEVPGPMTCGLVHPTIVLPPDAESWSEEDLDRALVHELEHVRRGDSMTHCLARVACAVYWFHPVVWIVWRRLALEAERSCDDAVLKRSDATAYADQLVGLAKSLSAAQRSPLLAMANRADLATRVHSVLDAQQRRGRVGAFSLVLAITFAMALGISMSSLILVATPQAALTRPVFVKPVDPQVQGQPFPKRLNPPRLVAQATPPAQPVPAAPKKLEFEVASVRRVEIPANGRGVPVFLPTGGIGTSDPTRYTWHGAWLMNLMTQAFGVRADQISGAAWLKVSKERYDIIANIPEGTTKEQFNAMLGNLLRDRFNLRFHMDSKILPVYALRVIKNGPKFKETARRGDDATAQAPLAAGRDAQGFVVLSADYRGMVSFPVPGEIFTTAQDIPMADLAGSIETAAGRPVIDETGLPGHYDFKLHREYGRGIVDSGAASNPAPSIFTALQEQLGLKLEPSSASFPQLIIDSIERDPVEN